MMTHIHWPGESKVIQKLKSLHVIFSYTTIIIGCHEMHSTPGRHCSSDGVFFIKTKTKKQKDLDKQLFRNRKDTPGYRIFQQHLWWHYHRMWFGYRNSLLLYQDAAAKDKQYYTNHLTELKYYFVIVRISHYLNYKQKKWATRKESQYQRNEQTSIGSYHLMWIHDIH